MAYLISKVSVFFQHSEYYKKKVVNNCNMLPNTDYLMQIHEEVHFPFLQVGSSQIIFEREI